MKRPLLAAALFFAFFTGARADDAAGEEFIRVVETEKALNEALVLNFRREDGISQEAPIGRWEEVAKLKPEERVDAVKIAEESLVRLSYRCFPSYRPLLAEYQVVLASIARGKTEEVAKRLAELEENREVMLAKAKRGEDFLDWFEITRARETSGIFDDYLRLKDRLKANPRRRNDGISRYLDRVEEIFHREDQGNMTIWDR